MGRYIVSFVQLQIIVQPAKLSIPGTKITRNKNELFPLCFSQWGVWLIETNILVDPRVDPTT